MKKSIFAHPWSFLCLACLFLVSSNIWAQSKVETKPDVLPYLASCEHVDKNAQQNCSNKTLLEFVYGEVKYPKSAQKDKAEGTAVLDFIVEKDGSIGKTALIKSTNHAALDAEALRVLEVLKAKGNIWIPGKTNGKKVATSFKLPLRFKLS